MSKTGMWATIVLIVLLAAGAWWYVSNSSTPAPEVAPIADTNPPPPPPDTAGISGDSSDGGLDGDLKTLDAHVDAAATAGASADSFTDTPVQQAE